MASVILKNVDKKYENKFHAVKNTSLDIEDEEFVVIVGPSGCGKSTLLRMIAGLEEITNGEIYIGDKCINDVEPKNRDIAMVFQNYALYPHMTVYENMAFGLKLRKVNKEDIEKRVLEAAKVLGINDLLDRKPKQLSGGQRQRVALGRAIVRSPQVFLMDEPLSNLDAKLRVQMRSEIARLHNKLKTTIIYVTHDQIEAMTLGTKVVVMKDGKIQQVGTPKEIYNRPNNVFVASFIGTPQINLIDCNIVEKDERIYVEFEGGCLDLPKDKKDIIRANGYIGKSVILGVRPEDVELNVIQDTCKLKGTIDVVEHLGSELYIYISTSFGDIIAKKNVGEDELKIGDGIEFNFNIKKLLIFDAKSKNSIF